MAIIKSAKKRIKSSERKRIFNLRRSRTMKEEIKNFLSSIKKKDVKKAEEALPSLYKSIDKAAKRGIIKKNNAARKKSRLTKKIVELKK
ncbi:30S ribosomal protein S20 [Candidatus Campbellbacteria bacterium]|nr:MAG: 30S ribosomal protein S20 [Candidatus Campbellbacteria bacterium]